MNLAQLWNELDDQGRKELAAKVKTKPGYLWQIATHWRGKRPSVDLIADLVAAEPRLTARELVEEFAPRDPAAGAEGEASAIGLSHGLGAPVAGVA